MNIEEASEQTGNRYTRRRNARIERRRKKSRKKSYKYSMDIRTEVEQERIDNLNIDKVVILHPTKGFRYRSERIVDGTLRNKCLSLHQKLWGNYLAAHYN